MAMEAKANAVSFDAVVIGAGVAGLHQLYRLRGLGLKVICIDSAPGVGGTWYWNRYPGARFDSEGFIYQYFFSEDLFRDWSWSEKFPGQPEIERWMNYVADRLDLRKDIKLSTTVESAHFDEETERWTIATDRGDVIDTQFVVACTGPLSAPLTDLFPDQSTFKGQIYHTGRWPEAPVDFAGKRVAVIGNGSTGIQVIQTIAREVKSLKVFARTPQYVLPMKNPKYSAEDVVAYKARFRELAEVTPKTFAGFHYDFHETPWADLTAEQRREVYEANWRDGSLRLWLASFPDLFTVEEANKEISDFVREKMRERIDDPTLREALIPKSYGFGTRRVPLESGYLETYLRDNVELISIRDNPITKIKPDGIELADGRFYEVDIIILATGFDGATGALKKIDIRGRGGRSLRDEWNQDLRTTMGLQVYGYPNLFTPGAPLAPGAAFCNIPTCLQQQVEWISNCIKYMRDNGKAVIEPTKEKQDEWVAHHDEAANGTLIVKTDSWYMGTNVRGKPRRLVSYVGGAGVYNDMCIDIAKNGYAGFALS
ncbi:MAG: NAD(P)/FAD-dependent oxidoreductase [Proteobacteria bacterium]|nr:NAD(P)/FAD-dependent oxidoreductase [Pseudomonadota bacterium]